MQDCNEDKNNFVDMEEIMEQTRTNCYEKEEKNSANEQEIAVLNKNISKYEEQISNLFLMIGKTYYEVYKDDAEGFHQVVEVTTLYSKIEEAKRRIDELRGIVKCPKCDAEVDKNSRFCCNCGNKMITVIDDEHCDGCGAAINLGSMYCSICGMKIERESNINTSSCSVIVQEERHCCSCNSVLADDDVFCPECGTKVNT